MTQKIMHYINRIASVIEAKINAHKKQKRLSYSSVWGCTRREFKTDPEIYLLKDQPFIIKNRKYETFN